MKLLILGGTQFVGRHIAEIALARGHKITLLTRGHTNPDLFAGSPVVEKLIGDRATTEGLSVLSAPGQQWDAVIDTSGYFPRDVRASATLLADKAQRYLFISSISVYKDFSRKYLAEDYPVATMDNPEDANSISGGNYGPLKALCEHAAAEAFGSERTAIVRPGLVVGPYDPTNRFAYWPMRVERGNEVLAPGAPDRPVQFIDARDLADFTLTLLEQDASGVYNATGPMRRPLGMREFLETSRATLGGEATFTWVSDWLLQQYEVTPYTELPLWVPEEVESLGLGFINCRRALAAGLAYRPLPQTITDTFHWIQGIDQSFPPGPTLTPEKERRLLLGWHRLSHPFRG